jgi:cytochrome c oxidase subunit 2
MNEIMRRLLALPPQASTVAREIDSLHYVVILCTMAGATAVAVVAIWFTIRYRASKDPSPPGSPVEIVGLPVWIEAGLVALLASLFVGWWVVGVRQFMVLQDPPDDSMEVYVVGKQWMWKFTHASGMETESRLYVPAGRPVKLVMTSRDVIHSFYVPQFRVKQDLVPGRYTIAWFQADEPGVYPVLCAEFCGTGHSVRRGEVVVLVAEAWARFRDQRPGSTIEAPVFVEPARADAEVPAQPLELVDLGADVAAERGCLRCHTTDGSPHIGPSFAGLWGATVPLQAGGTVIADEAYLTQSMMDPLEHVHAGFQPVMPSYRGQLEPAETAALLELIRSLAAVERWSDPRAGAPSGAALAHEPYPAPAAPGLPEYADVPAAEGSP